MLSFPPFYLLRTNFTSSEILDLQKEIQEEHGRCLVFDHRETNIFVGRISRPSKAIMELKTVLGVYLEDLKKNEAQQKEEVRPEKRARIESGTRKGKEVIVLDDDETASEDDGSDTGRVELAARGKEKEVVVVDSDSDTASEKDVVEVTKLSSKPATKRVLVEEKDEDNIVKVIRLRWYQDSVRAGKVLPMEQYLIYQGRRIANPTFQFPAITPPIVKPKTMTLSVLARAKKDSPPPASFTKINFSHKHRRVSGSQSQHSQVHLLRSETTSEHDAALALPELPDFLMQPYSCRRPTPANSPNAPFIEQLKKIMQARKLQSDKIGARAYNAAIASIAAYPCTISTVEEILRLPSCGEKYGGLFQEWRDTGHIAEVDEYENDEKMKSLSIFYGIYDVEGLTATAFYNRGWRDLEDVARFGWDSILHRNQKIGIKVYDDLQLKIPRDEVERIGYTVLEYATRIRQGFQIVICGGYRRGKEMCGDVDVILTHPNETATDHLIEPLLELLQDDNYIPYLLDKSSRTSNRDQEPLAWKGGMKSAAGSGFDSLDKALIVWQDPAWAAMDTEPDSKNPNPHRRVDIIISPWKTAGCAIVGWSGGTMFERDLRSYCAKVRRWRFDSSGVRRKSDGEWVDLEGGEVDLLGKERRVFEGLGLDWIEPTMRCTDG